jgi:hypothetical protein
MLYAFTSITKSINILMNYNKTINEKTDIEKAKVRLLNELSLIKKMSKELTLILYREQDKNICDELYDGVNALIYIAKNITTIDQVKDTINKLTEFDCLEEFNNMNLYRTDLCSPSYEMSNYDRYMGEEELTTKECSQILTHINKTRAFNIMNTRAGKGITFSKLKNQEHDKIITYGLEHRDIYNDLKERCDKTIKGRLVGSRISNEVFDVMYLNPEVSWVGELTNVGNLAEKREKSCLRYHTKLLRPNGIVIYKIPFSRLTNDIAYNIAKMFNDVQVIKREDNRIQEILIFGIKDQSPQPKEDIYEYLKNLEYNQIDDDLELTYELPQGGIKTPDIFRGSELDKDDMSNLILNSGLIDNFWNEIDASKQQEEARPLMPFNMGQIGLVLTSGCLDGLVEEYEGQYHAIKGMVVKVRSNNVSSERSNEEIDIETVSNKVQINIVTPDGEFVELA